MPAETYTPVIAELVTTTVVAFPDYEFTQPCALAIAEDRLTAHVPWHMNGTNTGSFEPPCHAPTGRPIELPGIDVMCFRDGPIWRYRSVYNHSVIGRRLGLAPPRGGRLERAAVRPTAVRRPQIPTALSADTARGRSRRSPVCPAATGHDRQVWP